MSPKAIPLHWQKRVDTCANTCAHTHKHTCTQVHIHHHTCTHVCTHPCTHPRLPCTGLWDRIGILPLDDPRGCSVWAQCLLGVAGRGCASCGVSSVWSWPQIQAPDLGCTGLLELAAKAALPGSLASSCDIGVVFLLMGTSVK